MANGNDGGVSHLADARSKRQQRTRRIEALSLKLAGVSTAQIAERMGASLISIRAARRPTHRLAMSSSTTGTPRRAQLGLPTTQRLRQIQAEMTQRDQLIHFLTPSLSAGAAAGPSMSRHSPETPSRFSTGLCDPLAGHRVLSPKLKLFTDGKKNQTSALKPSSWATTAAIGSPPTAANAASYSACAASAAARVSSSLETSHSCLASAATSRACTSALSSAVAS